MVLVVEYVPHPFCLSRADYLHFQDSFGISIVFKAYIHIAYLFFSRQGAVQFVVEVPSYPVGGNDVVLELLRVVAVVYCRSG